jgi:urea transport system permease protein
MQRLFAIVTMLGLVACLALIAPRHALSQGAPAGSAASYNAALDRFAADSFSETEAAIAAIASAGSEQSLPVLEALLDRRLFAVGPLVFYRDAAGAAIDARTGSMLAAPPTDAAMVRLNNRLRNVVQTAIGTLTLLSTDPAKRLQAAESVTRSRDAAALPIIETALSRETVPRIRRAFEQAKAAITLYDDKASEGDRAAAARLIAQNGDQEGLGLLRPALATATGDVKTAIEQGISAIENRQRLREVGQTIWFGISLGSVLLLAAIGLAITFGVMGIINMAHGEMVMIGAYVTFGVQEVIRSHAPGLFDWSLLIALPLAFLVSGAVGVAIERGIIRFLYGRPLETLLATFGVSLILQQAIRTWFGPTNREVGAPSYMSGSFDVLGLQITYGRLWIVVFTFVVFGLILAVMKATPLGLQMRAVTQNRRMASAMGIRTRFVDAMTFGLGSGIAGIAGVALSQIDNVSPNLGQSYIIDSFMVVVFGGVGNLWGTLLGAFTLGIANKLLEPFVGAVLGKILILVMLILFIQKRPRGLFALKGRAVEA